MDKIKVYEGFLSNEEVDMLRNAMENNMDKFYSATPAKLERSFGLGQDNFPSSTNFNNPKPSSEVFPEIADFIKDYVKRIEEVAKADSGLDVVLSVLWFIRTQGVHFDAHTDNDGDLLYKYDHTCLLYLNDCYDSGQLHFPDQGFTYSPRKGDLVSFSPDYVHEVWKMDEVRYTMPSWFTVDKKYSLFGESREIS